ncbi:MAG: NfeD family protein [Gemmatimonadales bacterium]|nr:NfeD family protein [Gemmatimonadales bacterium]MDZ4389110.1 NfeD family protein [Gemmatimonadales bacterium]
MRARILGLLVAVLGLASTASAQGGVVYRVEVSGVIENGLAPYIARAIDAAGTAGASAVILEIDTPGGRVDAAERIADAIRGSSVPVTAWVHPRAFSAGALIALAADRIYMTTGGVMGAATPVDGQGTKASEKMVSAMRAEFRALAEARGRDPRLAEAMVDESIDITDLAPTGQLLTMTTTQAVEVGYAEGVADDLEAVLAALEFPDARVVSVELNWAEQLVRFLTHPAVSPLLLSLGMLGLIFEIKSGAFGVGGLLSVVSLGLFFGSSFLLGLAGWEEVILLGVGLIAVAVEVFILPGFGIAGLLGAIALGAAVVLAMLGSAPTGADMMGALAVLGVAVVISVAVVFAWLRHLPTSQRFTGLLLKNSAQRSEGYISGDVRDDLIGVTGIAMTDLRPAGTAEINGERMDVVTEGDFVKAGATITVVRSEGFRHVVRLAHPASQLPA